MTGLQPIRVTGSKLIIVYSTYLQFYFPVTYVSQYGSLGGPFGPVIDGVGGVLPYSPKELRDRQQFQRMKIMAGVTRDAGAYKAREYTRPLCYLAIAIRSQLFLSFSFFFKHL